MIFFLKEIFLNRFSLQNRNIFEEKKTESMIIIEKLKHESESMFSLIIFHKPQMPHVPYLNSITLFKPDKFNFKFMKTTNFHSQGRKKRKKNGHWIFNIFNISQAPAMFLSSTIFHFSSIMLITQ